MIHQTLSKPRSHGIDVTGCDRSRSSSYSDETQQSIAVQLDNYASRLEAGDESGAEELLKGFPELELNWAEHLQMLRALSRSTRQAHQTHPKHSVAGAGVLGDYQLNREIGRGGMGIVYEATQISLRRSVALKVLPFAAVLDKQQVVRFRNEAQAAASLHHPHIVPVFAVGCERGVHYYSMQLIDGRTMEELFCELTAGRSRNRYDQPVAGLAYSAPYRTTDEMPMGSHRASPLSNAELGSQADLPHNHHTTQPGIAPAASTLQTIRQRGYIEDTIQQIICIADALDFAHQQGVVHRDVKPSNLLIDSSGKIWIADFGLARVRGTANMTAEGKIMGTARYMSPEQIAGKQHEIDHRTDIYALGITLYELLTLQPAFEAADREALFHKVLSEGPESPRRINSAIEIDLETIVLKSIAKRKDDRYATAGEMAEDLRLFLAGKPTLARRPTLFERAKKWSSRNPRLVATTVALLIIAVVSLATANQLISHQSDLKDQAAARARLHLDQSHSVVDRFGGLIARRLESLPGGDALRAEVLREAERYYSDFLAYGDAAGTSPSEIAKVRYRLAVTYASLGESERAERTYEEAIASYRSLAGDAADRPEEQANLAICFHNLAALQKDLGRYSDAATNYRRASDLQSPLLTSRLLFPRIVSEWAMTQTNLSLLLIQSSNSTQAASILHDVETTLQDALKQQPDSVPLRLQLIECNNSMVATLIDSDLIKSEALLRVNLSELDDILSMDKPHDLASVDGTLWITDQSIECQLAVTQSNLATVLARSDRIGEALEVQTRPIDRLTRATKGGNIDAGCNEQLAIANANLGHIYSRIEGRESDAFAAFKMAEKMFRAQMESQRNRTESLSRLANVLHQHGWVHHVRGSESAAIECLSEAMEMQASAVKDAPFNQQYRDHLEQHRELLDQLLCQCNATAKREVITE